MRQAKRRPPRARWRRAVRRARGWRCRSPDPPRRRAAVRTCAPADPPPSCRYRACTGAMPSAPLDRISAACSSCRMRAWASAARSRSSTHRNGSPAEATRGGCVLVTTTSGLRPMLAATASTAGAAPSVSRCGAVISQYDRLTVAIADLDRHGAGALLEHHPGGFPMRRKRAARGQHERGADVGVAGERDLGGRREDAHPARVRRIVGRQHEGGLGVIELARDALHLLARQARRVRQHRERIAAEAPLGEHVTGAVAIAHDAPDPRPLRPACRQPSRPTQASPTLASAGQTIRPRTPWARLHQTRKW